MPKLGKHIDYSKVIELMNEGVVIDDENENIIYANEVFCKIIDRWLDEIIGKKSYTFWDKESENKIRNVDRTLRKKGLSSTYECVLMSKSGDKIPVLVSGAPRPEWGTVGIIADLTLIKQNERQAALLGHAIEKSSDAYIVFEESGNILLWNTWAQEIFGYTVKQADKMTLQEVLGSDFVPEKNSAYTKDEVHTKNKKWDDLHISVTIESLPNVQWQYLCIVRDITHYQQLQKSLVDRYGKMQSAYNEFGIMRRKMEYIYELNETAQKCNDIQEFGQFVISSIVMLTWVDACIFRLKKKKHLEMLCAFGIGSDWWWRKKVALKGSLALEAFENGPQKIFDSQWNSKYKSRALLKKNGFTSMMMFGLVFRWEHLGTITLHVKSKDKWHIFEDGFLMRYIQAVQVALWAILVEKKQEKE